MLNCTIVLLVLFPNIDTGQNINEIIYSCDKQTGRDIEVENFKVDLMLWRNLQKVPYCHKIRSVNNDMTKFTPFQILSMAKLYFTILSQYNYRLIKLLCDWNPSFWFDVNVSDLNIQHNKQINRTQNQINL